MYKNNFDQLVNKIMSIGYAEEVASHFAILIGDTPIKDQEGNVIVKEGDVELARLKLNFYD